MKPTVAIWKFSSCDGCQLTLLDCEDELLKIAGAVDIAFFPEGTSTMRDGPYDISIVEGSITTDHEKESIQKIRRESGLLIAIGACATSGGIQALKNFANVKEYTDIVYTNPKYIHTLETSTPFSDHTNVDLELRGCPINKTQLIEVISALVNSRRINNPTYSVCVECKLRGTSCVMVKDGISCLGPVTQAGCNAICPAYNRGCYGCYGPMDSTNPKALCAWFEKQGVARQDIMRLMRTFNAAAPKFKEVSKNYA